MDITLGELNKLPIKRLKEILKKLIKEPKNAETLTTIEIIKSLILDKKKKGTIIHGAYAKVDGTLMRAKQKPIHLI